MKNFLCCLMAFTLFLNVAMAQNVTIPDPKLKYLLLNEYCALRYNSTNFSRVDANYDGQIQVSEALAVTKLLFTTSLSQNLIDSLNGLEAFTNMLSLEISSTNVKRLNFQNMPKLQNLICDNNPITSVNLQNLPALKTLNLNNTPLLNLSLQNCDALKNLYCNSTTIASLDLSGRANLETLECIGTTNTRLANLNVQGCTNLKSINCSKNQFTTLNFYNLNSLEVLNSQSKAMLSDLILQGVTLLKNLDCSYCSVLSSLNIQDCTTTLTKLTCGGTNIAGLSLQNFPVLHSFNVASNSPNNRGLLNNLSFQNCPMLRNLDCSNNQLTTLNVSNLYSLSSVLCSANQLTALNFNNLPRLKTLECGTNPCNLLTLNYLDSLQNLDVSYTNCQSLNLQNLAELQTLTCSGAPIRSFNFQNVNKLATLTWNNCPFDTLHLENLPALTTLNLQSSATRTFELSLLPRLENIDLSWATTPYLTLSNLPMLKTLNCNNSLISKISLQNLDSLQTFSSNYARLDTLNLSNLSTLKSINCSYNAMRSLNITNLNKLETLYCTNNNLDSLTVAAPNFKTLYCSNNNMKYLNVSNCPNIYNLYCAVNQLTTLDLSNAKKLKFLECYTNRLTTLNVQVCAQLQLLRCLNNRLTSLFIKNGSTENPLEFSGNPNLTYICTDENELNNTQNSLNFYGYSNCAISTYCTFEPGGKFYTLLGNTRLDSNNDHICDTNDGNFPNMKYNIQGEGTIIANTSGAYNISVRVGTRILKPILEDPNYFSVSPDSAIVTFPNFYGDTITKTFCVKPNGVHHDVEVSIIPVQRARPGFDATYQIVYKNKGTSVESDSISLRFEDDVMDFLNANQTPNEQRNNFLVWQYTNLQPYETRSIMVTMRLNSPMQTPALNVGDILLLQATIYPFPNDEMPSNNRFSLRQTVVGSFDPNDKTCLEGREILTTQVGDYLHYLIRFENTGTAEAENIVVQDKIDATKFDINSLQLTKASHDCRVRILQNNHVEFIFQGINLPFTAPDKYGFVAFKIKTKASLALGNIVSNKADIYFDYNFPIATNTANTAVGQYLLSENTSAASPQIELMPNPVSDVLTIQTDIKIEKIEIFDNLGRLLQVNGEGQQPNSVSLAHLPKGVYAIKMYYANGAISRKFVKG